MCVLFLLFGGRGSFFLLPPLPPPFYFFILIYLILILLLLFSSSFFIDLLFYLFVEIVTRLKVTESRINEQKCFEGYSHVKHYRFDMTSLSLREKVSNLVFYAQSTTGKNSDECYYAKMYFTYKSSEHVFYFIFHVLMSHVLMFS